MHQITSSLPSLQIFFFQGARAQEARAKRTPELRGQAQNIRRARRRTLRSGRRELLAKRIRCMLDTLNSRTRHLLTFSKRSCYWRSNGLKKKRHTLGWRALQITWRRYGYFTMLGEALKRGSPFVCPSSRNLRSVTKENNGRFSSRGNAPNAFTSAVFAQELPTSLPVLRAEKASTATALRLTRSTVGGTASHSKAAPNAATDLRWYSAARRRMFSDHQLMPKTIACCNRNCRRFVLMVSVLLQRCLRLTQDPAAACAVAFRSTRPVRWRLPARSPAHPVPQGRWEDPGLVQSALRPTGRLLCAAAGNP